MEHATVSVKDSGGLVIMGVMGALASTILWKKYCRKKYYGYGNISLTLKTHNMKIQTRCLDSKGHNGLDKTSPLA